MNINDLTKICPMFSSNKITELTSISRIKIIN